MVGGTGFQSIFDPAMDLVDQPGLKQKLMAIGLLPTQIFNFLIQLKGKAHAFINKEI